MPDSDKEPNNPQIITWPSLMWDGSKGSCSQSILQQQLRLCIFRARILKVNGQKSFEQNVLQHLKLLELCFWGIQMMQMHVCGGECINTSFTSGQFARKYREPFLPRKAVVTFRVTPAVLTSWCWELSHHCCWVHGRGGEQRALSPAWGHFLSDSLFWQITKAWGVWGG